MRRRVRHRWPVHLSPPDAALVPRAQRAAAFPERTAVVDGERAADLGRAPRAGAAARRARSRRHGIERGDRVAFLAPNVTELLEAHFGVPGAGRRAGRDQHPADAGGDRATSSSTRARGCSSSTRRSRTSSRARRVERMLVCGAGGDYEDVPRSARRGGEPEAAARGRGRHDLDQLHERHDRPAEGRHVHAPRRLPERARARRCTPGSTRARSTSGRCRCSTATAGASPGP